MAGGEPANSDTVNNETSLETAQNRLGSELGNGQTVQTLRHARDDRIVESFR